jgi:hypothetical protein
LEVKDGRDHIVLQLRLYPDRIKLQGEWFNDRGQDMLMVFNRAENKTQMIAKGSQYDPRMDSIMIEPLFQYPSSKHWAQWNEVSESTPRSHALVSIIDGKVASIGMTPSAALSIFPKLHNLAIPVPFKVGDYIRTNFEYLNTGSAEAKHFKLLARSSIAYGDPRNPATIEWVWTQFSDWAKQTKSQQLFGGAIPVGSPGLWATTQGPYEKVTGKVLSDLKTGKAHIFMTVVLPFEDDTGKFVQEGCFWASEPADPQSNWGICGLHGSRIPQK